MVLRHQVFLLALEILWHQKDPGNLFLQATQGAPSLLYYLAFQEVLEGLVGPWDQAGRHRAPNFLFLLWSLFFREDLLCLLFLVVQVAQCYNAQHPILEVPAALVLQASLVVPGPPVFLEQNQLSQEYQLPLEILDDQETLVAQEIPSCLHRLLLVYLRAQGAQVVQQPLFLQSGQDALDPLEGL